MAFVAIQTIALAHELTHDLRQHDDASCTLHLQTKSAGGKPVVQGLPEPVFTDAGTPPVSDAIDLPLGSTGYHSRAPPSSVI